MAKVANIDALVSGQVDFASRGLAEQMTAVRAMCTKNGGGGHTTFASTVGCLLDVTSQLAELEVALRDAAEASQRGDAQTRKWAQISLSTMAFAQKSLLEQQVRALEMLEELSARGASISKDPEETARSGVSKVTAPPGLSPNRPLLQLEPPRSLRLSPPEQQEPEPAEAAASLFSKAELLSFMPQSSAKPNNGLKMMASAAITLASQRRSLSSSSSSLCKEAFLGPAGTTRGVSQVKVAENKNNPITLGSLMALVFCKRRQRL